MMRNPSWQHGHSRSHVVCSLLSLAYLLFSAECLVWKTKRACLPLRSMRIGTLSSTGSLNHDIISDSMSSLRDGTSTNTKEEIWRRLLENFQGDFDNYNQVVEDRQRGLLPREGGGHENFHCTLVPVSERGRLAAFYFDGNPQRIFRFRYYELLPNADLSPTSTGGVEMRLYTLQSDLEQLLRKHAQDPMEWPTLFSSFDDGSALENKVSYLPNCEITWSLDMDPVQHSYLDAEKDDDYGNNGLHAVMVHGEAIVDSTLIPGIKIRILDQLSLYKDVFYINDRGLDPETGAFIYGNQRGVPYRLERVARLVNGERQVVNEELKWTLGDAWRNEEDFKARIDFIGGPTTQPRKPPTSSDQ